MTRRDDRGDKEKKRFAQQGNITGAMGGDDIKRLEEWTGVMASVRSGRKKKTKERRDEARSGERKGKKKKGETGMDQGMESP